ncbi:MAG: sulfotransferase [Pseudomonadota bacterium]
MTQSTDPRAVFNKTIELINSGQIQQALVLCRERLQHTPDDISMIALLGATLLKTGKLSEAEQQLRRAIELAPSFAKPHEDLGFLLFEGGRIDEAINVLQTATRLDPNSELGFMTLGRALASKGQGEQADQAFEAAFELNPERKRLALAAEAQRDGKVDEAEEQYRMLLTEFPNNVDALRLLAGIFGSQTRYDEAEPLLRRAIGLAPDYTLAILDLGKLLTEQHRYVEAVEVLQQAAVMEPDRPKTHYLLAAALAPLGQTDASLEAYQRTLELRADHAGALLGVGHTLKTLGKQAEAIDAYRECIKWRPDNGESYWSLANLKTYQLTTEDITAMQACIEREDEISDQSMVNFLFALAKASEDQGDYQSSWDYYTRGNNKQRMLEHYDSVQTEVTNDEIIEVFDHELLNDDTNTGSPDPSPIFVVGLPRSGSTLIEQILASHSMVEGTSELPYMGRVATSLNRNRADGVNYPFAVRELKSSHLTALGEDYLRRARIHLHTDRPRFVDKMPNNFPTVGLIHKVLPNAKIIDARRYPLDSTLSCYRQLFAKGQTFVYDLEDIGEYFLEYQRLMDHWHETMPGRVLTVQYEDMVTDSEAQIRRLLDYCELPWEDACLDFHKTDRAVRTASSEQVRQPVYTSSVHFWRNYEEQLAPLIDILRPILGRYEQYEGINR